MKIKTNLLRTFTRTMFTNTKNKYLKDSPEYYDVNMLVTGSNGIYALCTIYFDSFAGVYRYNFSDCLVAGSTFNRWGQSVGIRCHFSMIATPGQGTGCMVQYKTQWRHLKDINVFVMRVFIKLRTCKIWKQVQTEKPCIKIVWLCYFLIYLLSF